jgi:Ca2+-binding RTX toxin-like protein
LIVDDEDFDSAVQLSISADITDPNGDGYWTSNEAKRDILHGDPQPGSKTACTEAISAKCFDCMELNWYPHQIDPELPVSMFYCPERSQDNCFTPIQECGENLPAIELRRVSNTYDERANLECMYAPYGMTIDAGSSDYEQRSQRYEQTKGLDPDCVSCWMKGRSLIPVDQLDLPGKAWVWYYCPESCLDVYPSKPKLVNVSALAEDEKDNTLYLLLPSDCLDGSTPKLLSNSKEDFEKKCEVQRPATCQSCYFDVKSLSREEGMEKTFYFCALNSAGEPECATSTQNSTCLGLWIPVLSAKTLVDNCQRAKSGADRKAAIKIYVHAQASLDMKMSFSGFGYWDPDYTTGESDSLAFEAYEHFLEKDLDEGGPPSQWYSKPIEADSRNWKYAGASLWSSDGEVLTPGFMAYYLPSNPDSIQGKDTLVSEVMLKVATSLAIDERQLRITAGQLHALKISAPSSYAMAALETILWSSHDGFLFRDSLKTNTKNFGMGDSTQQLTTYVDTNPAKYHVSLRKSHFMTNTNHGTNARMSALAVFVDGNEAYIFFGCIHCSAAEWGLWDSTYSESIVSSIKDTIEEALTKAHVSVVGFSYQMDVVTALQISFWSKPDPFVTTNFLAKFEKTYPDPGSGFLHQMKLNDISIALGHSLELIMPTLRKMTDFIRPVEPVLKKLVDPLPGISDVMGDDISILDIPNIVATLAPDPNIKFMARNANKLKNIIQQLIEMLKLIEELGAGGSDYLQLGNLRFFSNYPDEKGTKWEWNRAMVTSKTWESGIADETAIKRNIDPLFVYNWHQSLARQHRSLVHRVQYYHPKRTHQRTIFDAFGLDTWGGQLVDDEMIFEEVYEDYEEEELNGTVPHYEHKQVPKIMKRSTNEPPDGCQAATGANENTCQKLKSVSSMLDIPIIKKPTSLVRMIMFGDVVPLVTLTVKSAPLGFNFEIPGPSILGIVTLYFYGGFSVNLQMQLVLDSTFLNELDGEFTLSSIPNSLYIATDMGTGVALPIVSFTSQLGLSVKLNGGIIRASFSAGIVFTIDIFVYEPPPADLKVYMYELYALWPSPCGGNPALGPLNWLLFHFQLKIHLQLDIEVGFIFFWVTVYSKSWDFVLWDQTIIPGKVPLVGYKDETTGNLVVNVGSSSEVIKLVSLDGGSGVESVKVFRTFSPHGTPCTYTTAFDSVASISLEFGKQSGNELIVIGVQSPLRAIGGIADKVTLDFSDSVDVINWDIFVADASTMIQSDVGTNMNFFGFQRLSVVGTNQNDIFTVSGNIIPLSINGGSGDDYYELHNPNPPFDFSVFMATITIGDKHGEGNDMVVVNMKESTESLIGNLSKGVHTNQLTGFNMPFEIEISDVDNVEVHLGSGNDIFRFIAKVDLKTFVLYSGLGNDTAFLGTGLLSEDFGGMTSIQMTSKPKFYTDPPPAVINNQLFINDMRSLIATNWTLDELYLISSELTASIKYSQWSLFNLTTGSGNDHVVVTNTHTGDTAIYSSNGNDEILVEKTEGNTLINAGDGEDKFVAKGGTSKRVMLFLTLQGGPGPDLYNVTIAGYGNSLTTVGDQNVDHAVGDEFIIMGTEYDDRFLIRENFVAAMHPLDVDECQSQDICPKNAICTNLEPNKGGYICSCKLGFEDQSRNKDSLICEPMSSESCAEDPSSCGPNSKCDPVVWTCQPCDQTLNYFPSLDHLECKLKCPSATTCDGTEYCSKISNTCETCPSGTKLRTDKTDCEKVCPNCVAPAICIDFMCKCPPGYDSDGVNCINIQECLVYGCASPATCIEPEDNTRVCICNTPGWEVANTTLTGDAAFVGCVPIGSCGASPSNCTGNMACDSTVGECYTCPGDTLPNKRRTGCFKSCNSKHKETGNCDQNSICVTNSFGLDTCEPCPGTSFPSEDRLSCEFPKCTNQCDHIPFSICDFSSPDVSCRCISGYYMLNGICFPGVKAGSESYERYNFINLPTIIINAGPGDDSFYFDDTSGSVQVFGQEGNDEFFFGQLFNGPRDWQNIDLPTDRVDTTLTTVGYLTNGCSFPVTADGGHGDDLFYVLRNVGTLALLGGPDNDIFVVRAFALYDQEELTSPTDLQKVKIDGGGDEDKIAYAINAPVEVAGGPGYDVVILIGTEFADRFVITSQGVFGAGLYFVFGGIEEVNVLAIEGNDIIHILGTHPEVVTKVYGGKGSDTISITPREPQSVQSWNPRGHTGLLSHVILSGPDSYSSMAPIQVSANILDIDDYQIQVSDPTSNVLFEPSDISDHSFFDYSFVLSRPPNSCDIAPVKVNTITTRPPPESSWPDEYAYATSTSKRSPTPGIAVTADCTDWYQPHDIHINAVDSDGSDGTAYAFVTHTVWQKDENGQKFEYEGILARSVPFVAIDKDAFELTIIKPEVILVHEGPHGFDGVFTAYLRPCIDEVQSIKLEIITDPPNQINIISPEPFQFSTENSCSLTFTVQAIEDGKAEGWHFADIILQTFFPEPVCTRSGTCHNHGTCDATGHCSCDAGYGGTNCTYSRGDCNFAGNPITDTTTGTFTCNCDDGYSGNYCKSCDAANSYVGSFSCQHCDPTNCLNGNCNTQNQKGYGLCLCKANWIGEYCDVCQDNYYPKSGADACSVKCIPSVTCQGYHGCNIDGSCICAEGHTGDNCQTCNPGYVAKLFGDKMHCLPCDSTTCYNNGVCSTNPSAPEICSCPDNFAGSTCAECAPDKCGTDCSISCVLDDACYKHGGLIEEECVCSGPYYGPMCNYCNSAQFYFGPNSQAGSDKIIETDMLCYQCSDALATCRTHGTCVYPTVDNPYSCLCEPGYLPPDCHCNATVTCNGHGYCNEKEECVCETGYSGPSCTTCDIYAGYYGTMNPETGNKCTHCTSTTCNSFGLCNFTDGSCICNEGHTGPNCTNCLPSYKWSGPLNGCILCMDAVNCSGHGYCNSFGECVCDRGYIGENCASCDMERYYYGLTGTDSTAVTCGSWSGIKKQINIKIADSDSPGLIIRSDGHNDVIESYDSARNSFTWPNENDRKVYSVSLTMDPGQDLTLKIVSELVLQAKFNEQLKTSSWNQLGFSVEKTPESDLLHFDSSNWWIPQNVIVFGLIDNVPDGLGKMSFPASTSTVAWIQGPLSVYGDDSNQVPSLPKPIMLPEERDYLNPPAFDYSQTGDPLRAINDYQVDKLLIWDLDNFRNDTVTITNFVIDGLGLGRPKIIGGYLHQGAIAYSGFEDLRLYLGAGNNRVDIKSLNHTLTLNTGAGNDTIFVHAVDNHLFINTGTEDDTIIVSKAGFVTSIHALVSIDGGPGKDTLEINSSAYSDTVTINQHSVTGLGMAYSSEHVPFIQSIDLSTLEGDWSLRFTPTSDNVPRVVSSLTRDVPPEELELMLLSALFNNNLLSCGKGFTRCAPSFQVWNMGDVYYIEFIGELAKTHNKMPLSYSFESRKATQIFQNEDITLQSLLVGVHYHNMESLNIDTGNAADVVNVRSTSVPTIVRTHDGNDTMFISHNANITNEKAEQTQILSGWLDYIMANITFDAGPGNNRLMVSDNCTNFGKNVTLTDSSIEGMSNGTIFYFTEAGTFNEGIILFAGTGHDSFIVPSIHQTVGTNTVTKLFCGPGDDVVNITIKYVADGTFVIFGESGNDTIYGNTSSLSLIVFGGSGADHIFTGDGDDIIFGESGWVQYSQRSDIVGWEVVQQFGGSGTEDFTDGQICPITTIISDTDALIENCNDVIDSGAGNDVIIGGYGSDTINSGIGLDVVFGDQGIVTYDPSLSGQMLSIQTLDPTVGDKDFINGGAGDDIIFGGKSGDVLNGGEGSDVILGDFGHFFANANPLQVVSTISKEEIANSDGDTILGEGGDDFLMGQTGCDTIEGGDGDDDIIGGHNVAFGDDEGDAKLDGGTGHDVILGDNGIIKRTLISATTHPFLNQKIYANYPLAASAREVIKLDDIDELPYSSKGDLIFGGPGDDIIHGQRGNDIIIGDSGNDEIFGELGDDIIKGGEGDDWILGDCGEIVRQYTSNGQPKLTPTGRIQRAVTLEDVMKITNIFPTYKKCPASVMAAKMMFKSNLVVIAGRYFSNSTKVLDTNENWKTYLLLLDYVGRETDTIDGGPGDDFLFGQRGDDTIYGSGGNDIIFAESVHQEIPIHTNWPRITTRIRYLSAALWIRVAKGGNTFSVPFIVLPEQYQRNFAPDRYYGIGSLGHQNLLQIHENTLNITLKDGQILFPFVAFIPDILRNRESLPGNNIIYGGEGNDLIFSGKVLFDIPLRLYNANISIFEDAKSAVDMRRASISRHLRFFSANLEVYERNQSQYPSSVYASCNIIDGGPGEDLIVSGETIFIYGIFTEMDISSRRQSQKEGILSLYEYYRNLELILSNFEFCVFKLHKSLMEEFLIHEPQQPTIRPYHTLHIYEDKIQSGQGDDIVIGDEALIFTFFIERLVPQSLIPLDLIQELQVKKDIYDSQLKLQISFLDNSNSFTSKIPTVYPFSVFYGLDTIQNSQGSDYIVGDNGILMTTYALQEITQIIDARIEAIFQSLLDTLFFWGLPTANISPSGLWSKLQYFQNTSQFWKDLNQPLSGVDIIFGSGTDIIITESYVSVVVMSPKSTLTSTKSVLLFANSSFFFGFTLNSNTVDANQGNFLDSVSYIILLPYDVNIKRSGTNYISFITDSTPTRFINKIQSKIWSFFNQNHWEVFDLPLFKSLLTQNSKGQVLPSIGMLVIFEQHTEP